MPGLWFFKRTKEIKIIIRLICMVFGSWATWWLGGLKTKRRRNEREKEERKEKEKVEWEWQWQWLSGVGESGSVVHLWSIVSTAKRAHFCMKFWGKVLLNVMNIPTVVDFVFNGWIVRSVVGRLNLKTFI